MAAPSTPSDADLPENHPDVADADFANCPYLTASSGATARLGTEVSNDGVVPRALWWCVLLDIMGVGLVIPLLPSYARDLGAGPLFTGLLGTAYGLSQLVGASVLGRLSDVRGRRFVLFISLAGAASGYACLALAVGVFESLPLLFLSRLPIGLAKQTMTVARATVGDCTAAQGDLRTRRMGRLGMVAGTGFIFGPAIGGILSATAGLAVPPVLAVCLFCAALVIARGLPETAPQLVDAKDGKQKEAAAAAAAAAAASKKRPPLLAWLRQYPLLAKLLAYRGLVDFGFMLVQSTFAIFCTERFDMKPRGTGMVLAYVGIVSVGSQGWLLPALIRRLRPSDGQMLLSGGALVSFALAATALAPGYRSFMAALVPLAIGSSVFKTAASAYASKCVPRDEQGAASGATDSMESFCRVVAPTVGGALMQRYGSAAPGCVGALAAAAGVAALWGLLPRARAPPPSKAKDE